MNSLLVERALPEQDLGQSFVAGTRKGRAFGPLVGEPKIEQTQSESAMKSTVCDCRTSSKPRRLSRQLYEGEAIFSTRSSVGVDAGKGARVDPIEIAPPRGGWLPIAIPRTQLTALHLLIVL